MSRNRKKLKKLNETFLNEYIRVDSVCCEKFGIASGGATEYINRLINARFAPGRDEVLPRLVKYRNVRNKIAHEENALFTVSEITRSDLKWIACFEKSLVKRRDPISVYLRRARRYARRRRVFKRIGIVLALLLIAAGVAAYFIFL